MSRSMCALGAAGLAAALIAAGCGGGGDDSTTQAALPKAEWIARADAVCKRYGAEINSAARQLFTKGKPTEAQQEQFATDTVMPTIQKELDAARALPPIAEDADHAKAVLDTAQRELDAGKANPVAFVQSDPLAGSTRMAKQFGLKVCGQG